MSNFEPGSQTEHVLAKGRQVHQLSVLLALPQLGEDGLVSDVLWGLLSIPANQVFGQKARKLTD